MYYFAGWLYVIVCNLVQSVYNTILLCCAPDLQFGFIYIFNLIIGVGALTLPRAFTETGLVLASILLVFLCGVSFLTSTYMIEAMAAANAYFRLEERGKSPAVQASENGDKKGKVSEGDSSRLCVAVG